MCAIFQWMPPAPLSSRAFSGTQDQFDELNTGTTCHYGAAIWTKATNRAPDSDEDSWSEILPFWCSTNEKVLKGNLLWPPCFCVTCGFSSSRLCQDLQKCGDACRLLIVADQRSNFSSDPPKIDDCRTGPTRIDLRFDKATKVLGYNFWDNDESTSQNTKLFWRLEHTPSGCWAKYSQTPYLLFIPSPQY